MYDIFYISKEKDNNFFDLQKRFPLIKLAKYENKKSEAFFNSKNKSISKFFWLIDEGVSIDKNFNFEYQVLEWDKKYVHLFKQLNGTYGGVYLIPKDYPITKKEAEYNFFVNKKEIDIIAGKINYDQFTIEKPEDYFKAQKMCKTSMFYAVPQDYKLLEDFEIIVPNWDKSYVHVFKKDDNTYGDVFLIPKDYPITKNESEYSFFVNKKEIDIVASKLKFDIIFISYNEPNADKNFEKLLKRFPYAQRIHGVKGIHQAHIAAAKKAETTMFWVVDGDAIIEENFNFYLDVPKWDRDAVHVFRSCNPINDLVYGYGGVKLLPTKLVLSMKVDSVDMTTSISKKFIFIDQISNITSFNTDPFNTWKSAFRECVKLSSKVIDSQIDIETQKRLNIWCTVGTDKPFGEYSIKGAKAGREFGTKYANDKEMLKKINDWEWLENEFR